MEQPLELDGAEPYYLAFSLEAKGEGTLTIGALHKRLSHGPLGEMTVGAKTLRDTNAKKFLLISILRSEATFKHLLFWVSSSRRI